MCLLKRSILGAPGNYSLPFGNCPSSAFLEVRCLDSLYFSMVLCTQLPSFLLPSPGSRQQNKSEAFQAPTLAADPLLSFPGPAVRACRNALTVFIRSGTDAALEEQTEFVLIVCEISDLRPPRGVCDELLSASQNAS